MSDSERDASRGRFIRLSLAAPIVFAAGTRLRWPLGSDALAATLLDAAPRETRRRPRPHTGMRRRR